LNLKRAKEKEIVLMEPPTGILASLWQFILFIPYFTGLLLLGVIKGNKFQTWVRWCWHEIGLLDLCRPPLGLFHLFINLLQQLLKLAFLTNLAIFNAIKFPFF